MPRLHSRKRSVGATESVEWLRAARKVTLAGAVDPRKLILVDEMGANTALSPLYAYGPRGRRANAQVPHNRGANTTLLVGMNLKGMEPCLAVEGVATATVFEAYVEKVLAPTLRRGQVVVLNKLGAHESERARKMLEGQGCKLLFLPAYSADYNSIQEAFSKIKGASRKAQTRTREGL